MNPPGDTFPRGKDEDTADEAMKALTHLFSSRRMADRAHFRCGVSGPTDFDVVFEATLDQIFGWNANSSYKRRVRRLHKLGLISTLPSEWDAEFGAERAKNCSVVPFS
jgi:hypothetical protein